VIKKRNNPITGAMPEYSRKKPLIPEANDTSANAQTMIDEAPSPFKNRMQVPQIPAPTNPDNRANSQFHLDNRRFGAKGMPSSVKNKPTVPYGAVGYDKPYSSTRGLNSVNNGMAVQGKKQVGDGSFPKAIKTSAAKMKTNRDIFSPRVLHEAGLSKL